MTCGESPSWPHVLRARGRKSSGRAGEGLLRSSLARPPHPAFGHLLPSRWKRVSDTTGRRVSSRRRLGVLLSASTASSAAEWRRGALFCAGHPRAHAQFVPDTPQRVSASKKEGARLRSRRTEKGSATP